MASRAKSDHSDIVASVGTKEDVERFQRAVDRYVVKATRSSEEARETLRRVGILTRSGNLTKRYK